MEDADKETKEKIKAAAKEGRIVLPEGAEQMFPLSTDPEAFKDEKYEFAYVRLARAWGSREYPDNPEYNHHGGFVLVWGIKGFGFGELTFRHKGGTYNEGTEEWEDTECVCDSEGMSDKFIEAALSHFAKSVKNI